MQVSYRAIADDFRHNTMPRHGSLGKVWWGNLVHLSTTGKPHLPQHFFPPSSTSHHTSPTSNTQEIVSGLSSQTKPVDCTSECNHHSRQDVFQSSQLVRSPTLRILSDSDVLVVNRRWHLLLSDLDTNSPFRSHNSFAGARCSSAAGASDSPFTK